MIAPGERPLLFVHVRKTGGTPFGRVLANRFAASDCLTMAHGPAHEGRDLGAYRYVAGHVDLSFLDRFPQPPYVVTCLREPIERALSVFSYYRSFPLEHYGILRDDLGPAAFEGRDAAMRLARECSIDDFIGRAPGLAREHLGNVQTRVLSGLRPEGGGERLEDALAGLRRCDFVGLTERLDESAGWLARRLGWHELGPLPRENVSPHRVRRHELRPDTLTALEDLTALDASLYGRAVADYEHRLDEWAGAPDPRDPSARCSDAPPVSDLRFADAIRGGGWSGRERVGDESWFCWIGGGLSAWADLRVTDGASRLVAEIPHAIERSILETLRFTFAGRVLRHSLAPLDDGFRAEAALPRDLLPEREATARVEIEVDHAARPCDVHPGSVDRRELAIAVRRLALVD